MTPLRLSTDGRKEKDVSRRDAEDAHKSESAWWRERGKTALLSLTAPVITTRIPLIDQSLCQHYCVI
jgi:hypothetical protein